MSNEGNEALEVAGIAPIDEFSQTADSRQPTALDKRESIWTSSPPVEPGYYWWKQGERIEPCEVRDIGNGHLEAWFVGESDPLDQWQWQPDWMWADMPTPVGNGQKP